MIIKQNKESAITIHEHAGQPARPEDTINIASLVRDYYLKTPDVNVKAQQVHFGTSGHRGSASKLSFNEHHILAICQAIAEYRYDQGYKGRYF